MVKLFQAVIAVFFAMGGLASAMPPNSYKVDGGWACKDGYRKQAQQCNPIYVPPNARLEGKGWVCASGFKRQSNQCNPVKYSQTKKKPVPNKASAEI
ncbi:MAG: hypothetical protein ACPG47_06000, partial [Leucothrix sp.]